MRAVRIRVIPSPMRTVLRRSTFALLGFLSLSLFSTAAIAQTATPAFTEAQLTAFYAGLAPSSFATLPAAVGGKVPLKVGEGMVVAFPAEGSLSFNAILYTDDLFVRCKQVTELEGIMNVVVACEALKAGDTDLTITAMNPDGTPASQPWKKITVAISPQAASPTPAIEKPFGDVSSSHRHAAAITQLKTVGTIAGYPDGSFRPDATINRAEFAKIVVRTMGLEEIQGQGCFSDVNGEWFAPYVCAAKENGIIGGYPDGSFGPGESINFAEAVKIVVLAFSGEDKANFTATGGVAWYVPYLDYANENASLTLIDHLIPRPGSAMTRGQMAQLIANVLP